MSPSTKYHTLIHYSLNFVFLQALINFKTMVAETFSFFTLYQSEIKNDGGKTLLEVL